LGSSAMTTLALAASAISPRSVDDALEIGVTSTLGALAGSGLGLARAGEAGREMARGADLGLVAGAAAGWLASPYTEFSASDRVGTLALSGLGAWSGAWVPSWSGDAVGHGETTGAAGAGFALGAASGLALAQLIDTEASTPAEAS